MVLIALIGGIFWQNRPHGWSHENQIAQSSGDSRLVDLTADPSGNRLHLVWEDTRDNSTQVYYKRSVDDGVTWSQDIRLSNLTVPAFEPEPRIGTVGNRVLVFFSNETPTGEHIFYVSSVDGGNYFSPPIQLTNDTGDQSYVAVALVGSTIHLVYEDYFNGEEHIFYIKSSDAGLTWQDKIALTNTPEAQDHYPAIAAVNDRVFVAWCRYYRYHEAIYTKTSFDSGASWKPNVQVSEYSPPSFEEFSTVGSNGTQVHVAWGDGQGIQYSRSEDSGFTWSNPIPLTNTSRQYLAPRISVVHSHIQIVSAAISTVGAPPHIKVDSDVYYVSSSDGGQSWINPLSLTTHEFGRASLAPVIWSRGDITFVAWEDNRNGRLSIFFLSNPDFSALRGFEWQLFGLTAIALVVTTIVYVSLEIWIRRTASHHKNRRRRHSAR
jgi:hypothetical protein